MSDEKDLSSLCDEPLLTVSPINGTFSYALKLPAAPTGGEYLIRLESLSGLFPPTVRKVRLRAYQERDLFVTVDYAKEAYAPGDRVIGKVKVRRAGGGQITAAHVYFNAKVRTDIFTNI